MFLIFSLYLFSINLLVASFISSKLLNIWSNTWKTYLFLVSLSVLFSLLNWAKFFSSTLWNSFSRKRVLSANMRIFSSAYSRFLSSSFTIASSSLIIFRYFLSSDCCSMKWKLLIFVFPFTGLASYYAPTMLRVSLLFMVRLLRIVISWLIKLFTV